MSKHLTAEELALYTDAMRLNRTDELPARLARHVASCEKCKNEILVLLELSDELSPHSREPHPWFDRPAPPPRSPWETVWRVAAVLALAVGLGVIWYTLDPPGATVPEVRDAFLQIDSAAVDESPVAPVPHQAQEPPRSQDLAALYEPSPNLDDLVGMPLRSSPPARFSPPAGAVLNGSVQLAWETELPGPFAVSILDNADGVILDTTLSLSVLAVPGELGPGLYYWKVATGGKLQFVSKFFVKERPWGEELPR